MLSQIVPASMVLEGPQTDIDRYIAWLRLGVATLCFAYLSAVRFGAVLGEKPVNNRQFISNLMSSTLFFALFLRHSNQYPFFQNVK